MFLSSRTGNMPNGTPIINSESDYMGALHQVLNLTHDGVANFNTGEDLDQRQKDDIRQAVKLLDSMNTFKESEAAGFFESGLLDYLVGDTDTAKVRIQQALNNAKITPNLKTPTAQASLEGVIADSHHILGLIAFDRHDYDTASRELDEAIKVVTDNHLSRPNIYVARARVEVQLNKLDQARRDVRQAFAMDPSCPQALKLTTFLNHLSKSS